MKKTNHYCIAFMLSTALLVLVFEFSSSQSLTFDCQIEDQIDNLYNKNGDCGTNLLGDFQFYDDIDTYIPNFDGEPLHNPPMKKINININIFQKSDGTGNFPDNEETRDRFRQILIWVNNIYKVGVPCDPIPGVVDIDETYISFDMGEEGSERIYFYQNDNLWSETSGGDLLNFIQNNYTERLENLNVFIAGTPSTNHANWPSYINLDKDLFSYIGGWYDGSHTDFGQANSLAHELGHNLQQLHTYYGGGASANCDNNNEYLSDVFGVWPGNCPHLKEWSPDACDNTIPNGDRITNNLMGGNHSNNYSSPKQAGKMHRSLALTSVRKYVDQDVYNGDVPLVIEQNEVWDFDIKLYRDLIINPGVELTISCKLLMPWEGRITIKPSGKLIVDGGIVTTDANTFWTGIIVEGNAEAHQHTISGSCAQGQLILKNGAIVENAVFGALAGGLLEQGGFDDTKAGGIIQVIGNNSLLDPSASFVNNDRAVTFRPYQNFNLFTGAPMPNRSNFTNAKFEVNQDCFSATWNDEMVRLDEVDGVVFSGCSFVNNLNNTGKGIDANGSGFRVKAVCTSQVHPCPEQSLDKSTFDNFAMAIEADNPEIYTFTVEDAIFNNNSYGIKMTYVNNATVLFSDFYIGQPSEGEQQECGGKASAYGIYMDNCTGFAIEENEFYKAEGAPTGNYTGIRINNTEAADEVYNNIFEGLSYANYAEAKNWKDNYTWQGLAYYCNDNTGNWQDITVADIPDQFDGIQNPIGSDELPAGNTFSDNANSNIYNDGDYWIGYFYYGNTGTPYYPDIVYRVTRSAVTNNQNECLSHYGGGGSGGDERGLVLSPGEKLETEQSYAENLADYNNVKVLYDNLKDGGNTEATLEDVETSWPSEMWELRTELLGKSPHLSMEVLKAAADKTDVLPESIIFEIMAANPDELKKEELIKYLEDKENPLPEYMIDILEQVASGTTYKTVLQKEMAHYNRLKTRAAHDMIRSIVNDTIVSLSELRNWLDNLGGKRADEQIISSYIQEGNYTDAQALAGMMPGLYNYSGKELVEHNYYTELLNLRINLGQQGRSFFDLDSAEVINLAYVANNSIGTAGAQARGILESAYGYDFCNCLNVSDSAGYKSSGFSYGALNKAFEPEIEATPNPASDWVAFNYVLPDNTAEGIIKITDVNGRIIEAFTVNGTKGQKVWDTRKTDSGIYFYTFDVNSISKSGKLVITK